MGNRAFVVFENKKQTERSAAIYLHNNGGPESIYPFLDALDVVMENRFQDLAYESARFVQIVSNFFGGCLGIGIQVLPDISDKTLDAWAEDNGFYFVCRLGPGKRTMRRFDNHRWLTQAQIGTERRVAYKHRYNTGKREDETDSMPFVEQLKRICKGVEAVRKHEEKDAVDPAYLVLGFDDKLQEIYEQVSKALST